MVLGILSGSIDPASRITDKSGGAEAPQPGAITCCSGRLASDGDPVP